MKAKTNTVNDILYLSLLIILIILSLLSYRRILQLNASSEWVARSNEQQLLLNRVFSNTINAETCQRGFLLTGDTAFLATLRSSENGVKQDLESIAGYYTGNDTLSQLATHLTRLIDARLEMLNTNLYLIKEKGYPYDSIRPRMHTGKDSMTLISGQVNKMLALQNREFSEIIKQKKEAAFFTPLYSLVFSLVTVLVVSILYFRLRKEMQLRIKAAITKNQELEKTNAEIASFSYIASHDLQEPLRKIKSFSQLIKQSEGASLSENARKYFERIEWSATGMQQLIEDLLNYASTGTVQRAADAVDLNTLVDNLVKNQQDAFDEKNATVRVSKLPVINGQYGLVEQLFTNLLSNAIKYSRNDTPLMLSISAATVLTAEPDAAPKKVTRKYWRIDLADNGIGFDQQYAAKLFDIFYRLHGKHQYKGAGIGLAICKKIMTIHNGFITASGIPGEGAVFSIYFPTN